MGISAIDIKNLIDGTIKDLPKPTIVDLICACDEEHIDLMFDFIKKHYSEDEILQGIKEYTKRIKFMNQLYGNKQCNK